MFDITNNNAKEPVIIDIHGYNFYQASTDLIDEIENYYNLGCNQFLIIHGYNRGTVLRNYIRTQLKHDILIELGLKIKVYPEGKGASVITISG